MECFRREYESKAHFNSSLSLSPSFPLPFLSLRAYMEVEDFPDFEDPIDDEEIEAAVRGASASASASENWTMDRMRNIPIEDGGNGGDRKCDTIRPSQARRLLPNWSAAVAVGTSASSSSTVVVEDLGSETRSGKGGSSGGREWKALLPHPRSQADSKVKYPAMSFGGQIVYARTHVEVEKATLQLMGILKTKKKSTEKISVGFDIEWRPTFIKGQAPKKAAVMQICGDNDHCFVMHIFHSAIPPTLRAFLADSSYVKVGISIAGDVAKIMKDYGVDISPCDDLSEHANRKLGGPQKQWGLSSLTEKLACKQLAKPKKIRLGNWEAKVLSKVQLHYAATDAYSSWFLYEYLKSFPEATSG